MSDEEINKDSKANKRPRIDEEFNNRYEINHPGPYIVRIVDDSGNLGNIHPLAVAKNFKSVSNQLINVSRSQQDKIILSFSNFTYANNFVDSFKNFPNKKENWYAYIPYSNIWRVGVIKDIDPTFTDEEIIEGFNCSINNSSIGKIERFRKSNLSDTIVERGNKPILPLVKIFFKDSILPNSIRIFGAIRKVFPYIPPVRICFNCLHYGHQSDNCKGKPRCKKCAANHNSNECDSEEIRCCNCDGNHIATYSKCRVFKIYSNINKVRVNNNYSFQDAKKLVMDSYSSNSGFSDSIKTDFNTKETRKSENHNQLMTSTPIKNSDNRENSNLVTKKIVFSKEQVDVMKAMIDKSVAIAVQNIAEKTTKNFIDFLIVEFEGDPNKELIIDKIQASGKKFLEKLEKHE